MNSGVIDLKLPTSILPFTLNLLQSELGELYGRNPARAGGRAVAGFKQFPRNIRTINRQIKEAASTFRLAGAGVENYEKTITGTESKLSHAGTEAHPAAGCNETRYGKSTSKEKFTGF